MVQWMITLSKHSSCYVQVTVSQQRRPVAATTNQLISAVSNKGVTDSTALLFSSEVSDQQLLRQLSR
jgi:hypothetical protein